MANMWIFTPDGFYSPRHDSFCEDDEVMIRSRCKEDLLRLSKKLGIAHPTIKRIDGADYLYRMKIDMNDWAVYVARVALDVNAPSIKDFRDWNSYRAYTAVWEIMQWLQQREDAEIKQDEDLCEYLDNEYTERFDWSEISYDNQRQRKLTLEDLAYDGIARIIADEKHTVRVSHKKKKKPRKNRRRGKRLAFYNDKRVKFPYNI